MAGLARTRAEHSRARGPIDLPFPARAFRFTPIADTSGDFRDFGPFVASLDDRGRVAFGATLKSGGAGVFVGDGRGIRLIVDAAAGPFATFSSHPDVDSDGRVCFYAELKSGGKGVFRIGDGKTLTIADTDGAFAEIGPLGPTMEDSGVVAFRADMKSGESGVFTGDGQQTATIATTGARFSAFHGLPVIGSDGRVVFRADRADGVQGIYSAGPGHRADALVETDEVFRELGLFPFLGDDGIVVFCAVRQDGGAGVFTAKEGGIASLVDSSSPFQSFRGALIDGRGRVVFYATPKGGQLGIFSGPSPIADRALGIGDPLFGSTVVEFALNPVSINRGGQMAIRVALDNGTQLVLRCDPSS